MNALTPEEALAALRVEWRTADVDTRHEIQRLARAIAIVRDVPPAATRKAVA